MIAQMNYHYIKTRPWKVYSRLISYAFFEGRPVTTRGRWFNKIVFFTLKLSKLLPSIKKVQKPTFIIGTGRSGTTILGIVLSMHKDIGYLNEPKALWHEIYKYEDIIGNYTNLEAKYFLDESMVNNFNIYNAHKIYSNYLLFTFSNRVVDKYPELIFRIPFVKKIFPDAKFLFLVRNGWDTCISIEQWSKRLGITNKYEVQDWWGVNKRKWTLLVSDVILKDNYFKSIWPCIDTINNHIDMAALEWIASMRQGLKMMSKYPNDILRIDYEELVKKPKIVLKTIEDFMELDNDQTFINYGCEILKPNPPKRRIKLNDRILPLFIDTMNSLGYK